jgi:hypothetical protein
MTIDEARCEAQRRWGVPGSVKMDDGQCVVGTIGGDMMANGTFGYGRGWTWEEAFADADRRAGAK